MHTKRIFILNGHPAERSFSQAAAEHYAQAARDAGHSVRVVHIADMAFDGDFASNSFENTKPLEPALAKFKEDLDWAEHFVLLTPMWWGGVPAKLKGLFDRVFLPGWAFDTRKIKHGMPAPMLGGRSARVFITSDTPDFLFGVMYRRALVHQIKGQVLRFIGLKPVAATHFSPMNKATAVKREAWLDKVRGFARQAV